MNSKSKIMVLGSCFADGIGKRLRTEGFDVCLNPFGTLFNPASIKYSIDRMRRAEKFTAQECVRMGANAGKICSFSHHTSFARADAGEFLENANARLEEASRAWEQADTVIITLGTAFVWKHQPEGRIVSNCLKRPGYEFTHELLSLQEVKNLLNAIVSSAPEKEFILTVSPIRHLGDGAHSNQVSKSILLLAEESVLDSGRVRYFPAYEILLDELRDYRWYAQDRVHPSPEAVDVIWERFLPWAEDGRL